MRFPAVLTTGLLLVPLASLVSLASLEATGFEEASPDLRGLLSRGWILQDRNGDGHPDFVEVRLVVPADAGGAEAAAAANVAARLGFESYGTDLDLVTRDGPDAAPRATPVVIIGHAEHLLAAAGISPDEALADLAPGEGVLQSLPSSDVLPQGGLWIAGADATGLLGAAEYFSARYPGIWAPDGATYEELAASLAEFLAEVEVDVDVEQLAVERAVLTTAREGVARVEVLLRLDDMDEVERARRRLRGESEQREGVEGDTITAPDPRSLLVPGLHRLDVRIVGPEDVDEIHRIRPERPWSADEPREWQPRDVDAFTLSDLYTLRGIYRDTEQDLVPDRSEAWISVHGGGGAEGAANLALRIALETAGIRLPIARVAGQDDHPEMAGFPILFGVGHHVTERLRDEGRLGVPSGNPGEGFVELVAGALDGKHALVVGGSDARGLAVGAELAARRLPYLHDPRGGQRKGSYRLEDLEEEVRRFFQARGTAGQLALALHKLEQWGARLEAGERPGVPASDMPWPPRAPEGGGEGAGALQELRLELNLDTVPEGLAAHLSSFFQARFPDVDAQIELHPVAFGAGEPVFDRAITIPWEVDEVRRVLRDEVYGALAPGSAGRIEVRVSEPPEIRRALEAEIRSDLRNGGIADEDWEVTVLSAYKQGFSWIEDAVLPRMRTLDVSRVEIAYHHLLESEEIPWKVLGSDTRWLQELFPVDAVIARELGIADSAVVFQAVREPDQVYRIRAMDARGAVVLEDTFSPTYVIRPYFDLHPDYERVRVTTGLVRVEADGQRLLDRRIRTDLEAFWDAWQAEIHPRLRDYLLDLHQGALTPGTAPFFDELTIEVRLSEPNHRIGVDEEVVSSLESLHNDLYFNTLAFLGHLGDHYGVGSLSYAGRILPHIDPTGAGAAGEARVRLTGKSRASPELVLRVRADGEEEGRWRYPLTPLPTEAPALRGLAVAGNAELTRALFEVEARDSIDRFDEHRGRATEASLDRSFLPVELLEGMVDQVRDLHAAGVLPEALSYEGIGELAFRFVVEDEDDFRRGATLPRSASPTPTRNPVLAAEGWSRDAERGDGESIVQWETPIPPAESDSVMARLGTFPEATVYFVGRSFLGKDIFAADFGPPVDAELVSQAKLNALRPTLFLSGRQHANEVSSTSHILRLGELLVTDPEYRELLQNVNVVLHPVTNPDGAQLAWEMQRVNPDFTLHAGYLGALGVDMTQGGGGDDPIYPESRVRPHLMETWLPDIYLNLHGYPSHEWVQHFSGYAAWVRGRTVAQRTWWAPRGWFIPGFTWVDDPDHPEITTAQFAILDTIAAAITGVPEVAEMSARQYARYAKYGRQDVDGFREHFHEGVLMYLSLRGRSATGSGPGSPRINTFSATTEAPDETARGDWLELVASAGLAHTSALAGYLAGGTFAIERDSEVFDGWVTHRRFRTRPVLPPDEVDEEIGSGG